MTQQTPTTLRPPAPSVAYFTTALLLCWGRDKLQAAAALWPPDPTWAWWLGERLLGMSRREAMERCSVAVAHLGAQARRFNMRAPRSPAQLHAYFKTCSEAELVRTAAAFGEWLDDHENAALLDKLAALLRGETPGLVEVPPPAEQPEQPPADE